jgi:hypothetical protein
MDVPPLSSNLFAAQEQRQRVTEIENSFFWEKPLGAVKALMVSA